MRLAPSRPALLALLGCAALATAGEAAPLLDPAAFAGVGPDARISADAGGAQVRLDLGSRRSNWTNARWAVATFDQPRDLSAAVGLSLTVATAAPRADAGVYVALREADGTWYCHPWACELTRPENTGTARFGDFATADYLALPDGSHVDENGRLDRERISAVAIGCVNPFGIGTLAFTLRRLDLVPGAEPAAPAVAVRVAGRWLDVNGTTCVPAGLFGGFALPKGANARYRLAQDRAIGWIDGKPRLGDAITHMVINTAGDRGAASPIANDPQWEPKLRAAAAAAGAAAKAAGRTLYVEWWNEPYLNWANKNRVAFKTEFFDESRAVEGAPVHLKRDGSLCPHLRWTRDFAKPIWNWASPRYTADGRDNWRRGRDAGGTVWGALYQPPPWSRRKDYHPAWHPPRDVPDGATYTITVKGEKGAADKDLTLTAFTPWWIYDETQFTFWSASGLGRFYNEPMLACGQALKAADPTAVFIAGWGFRPSEDHWAGFTLDYQPTIDLGAAVIDGICDHDYGGEATKMAASYELVCAYGVTRHKKWLHSYNTETAAAIDPAAYPGAEAMQKAADADRYKAIWTARKLMHSLATVPDKARAFSWFGSHGDGGSAGPWFSHGGEGVVLTALRTLRGRLLAAACDDPTLYAVAAVDGSDPLNPRPDDLPKGHELVVAVLNDRAHSRRVRLEVAAPAGTAFAAGIVRELRMPEGAAPALAERAHDSSGAATSVEVDLPPRGLAVLALPLTAAPDLATAPVRRRQFFAPAILGTVAGGAPAATTIAIDPAVLPGARRAWLRLVAERLADGEGVVTVNGTAIPLPAAITPENTAYVRDIPLPPGVLKAANEVVFATTAPERAGYLVATASVFVEGD